MRTAPSPGLAPASHSLRQAIAATAAVAIAASAAAQRAPDLLPQGTVGMIALADAPAFRDAWGSTQLGRFVSDESMRPFMDQLQGKLNRRFGDLPERLGVSLEELLELATGEVAFASVAPAEGGAEPPSMSLLQVTGREAETAAVVAKIDARLIERGATPTAGGDTRVYAVPADDAAKRPARQVVVAAAGDWLLLASDAVLATRVIDALAGRASGPTLAETPAYRATAERAGDAAGRTGGATVRWFLDPFTYERVERESAPDADLPDKKGIAQILAEQGFDAITGVGGVIAVAPDAGRDFVHHTFVYAPPKPGTEGRPANEKYRLAMRMAALPNDSGSLGGARPPVEPWAPRQVATYKTFHVDIANAFDHLGSLFDAVAGFEDAFDTTLTSFEKDPYGPQVNVRDEIVAFLGSRIVVMTDYTLPITPECERYLMAIDVTDQEALDAPIARWLVNDGAERRELDGVAYWELIPEDEEIVDADDDLLLDDPAPIRRADEDEPERVLRRAAVCLHDDRLFIASDAEFLRQALFGVAPGDSLAASPDVAATLAQLDRIAPGRRAAWNFSRGDEGLRPTYELIRAGEMPQGQTFFARLLNRLLTSDEEREVDALREQRIDGSLLPSFEMARRYFGPSARSLRSDDDGWLVSGVVLSKGAPPAVRPSVARARAR
ncbi:MAG: hypothetical protein AAF805_00670 [Planctomycetota bacterium]